MLAAMFKPPGPCPACGDDVPARALACPGCGADARSGWRDEALGYDGVDLDDEFDYEAFVREEFGPGGRGANQLPMAWRLMVIVLVVIFLLGVLGAGIWLGR